MYQACQACLTHSWICTDHIEENIPLLNAHHEELQMMINPRPLPRVQTNPGFTPRKHKTLTCLTCRIGGTLEKSGKYEGKLYVNHYGSHPIHCPQWRGISVDWRVHISRQAKYCTQCFSPRIFIENTTEKKKHYRKAPFHTQTNVCSHV